jgi:diketogulonate reductase-like aldo/keto reductase
MEYVTLHTGAQMPFIGLGTWALRGEEGSAAVERALAMGYRHIDTAEGYGNEAEVGEGIRRAGLPREELFVTTKVGMNHLRQEDVLSACEGSLQRLGLDYLDLYLVHWPNREIPMAETFGALARLHAEGRVRHVGVSNFYEFHLREAVLVSPVPIAANQVEYHPYLNQRELLTWCRERSIVVESYSPIAQGRILQDPLLLELAAKYQRSVAQVCLRWLTQIGVPAIPKASSEEHLRANLALFDWALDADDLARIEAIPHLYRVINAGRSAYFVTQ